MNQQQINQHLTSNSPLTDIKLLIKKIKGLTYHKRSKKFQVQVFFNDPDKVINTTNKKHTFKSKSFSTIKEALIGRNLIIDNINSLIPTHNPLTNFNKKTYEDLRTDYQTLISIYESPLENQSQILQPRTNNECYICFDDFEDDNDTISICGHGSHHIHRACFEAGNAAANNPHEYLGHMNTSAKCGICRGQLNSNSNPIIKARNDKRKEFKNYLE